MTILCTGWKRLTPKLSVHAPKCPVNLNDGNDQEVTHGISEECEILYRQSNGLRPKEKK